MRKLLLIAILFLSALSQGQTITVDETFNNGSMGANSGIVDFAIQPDGKIIIVGSFSAYNGVTRNRIARLNTDGTLDTSFNAGNSANGAINAVALTNDGKIIVGGGFTTFNGISTKFVARLNNTGTVDTTFNTFIPSEPNYSAKVSVIVVQQNGKIMVGGDFAIMDIANLYRLNANGSVDTTFQPTSVQDITAIKVLDSGKVLIGQNYPTGQRIRRVDPNGEYDSTFITDIPNTINYIAFSFHVQQDGKILVPGAFVGDTNNPNRWPAIRLNNDGSTDTAFQKYFVDAMSAGSAYGMLEYNGKYLLYGSFQALDSSMPNNIALVNTEGLPESSPNFGIGFNGPVRKMATLSNGQILAAGIFTEFNGVQRGRLVRLNSGNLSTNDFSSPHTVRVFSENGHLNFTSDMIINTIQVYDVSGRSVYNSGPLNSLQYFINLPAMNQVLISRVTLENGTVIT
ncbi:MAG: hypothetical protein EOO45_18960, partial [Flavobacterium sp.]